MITTINAVFLPENDPHVMYTFFDERGGSTFWGSSFAAGDPDAIDTENVHTDSPMAGTSQRMEVDFARKITDFSMVSMVHGFQPAPCDDTKKGSSIHLHRLIVTQIHHPY